MSLLRRLAPALRWFGRLLVLGSTAGLLVLGASLVWPRGGLPHPFTSRAGVLRLPEAPSTAVLTPAGAVGAEAADPILWIPKINLRAPIVAVSTQSLTVAGQVIAQLEVPNAFAVGWSATSAAVGAEGNTVLVGHNNEFGEVFRDLEYLAAGDEITVAAADGEHHYVVAEVRYLDEQDQPLAERLNNAVWIEPTHDVRLTLVTCWPYYTNTHRLVVVAYPAT